MHAGGAASCGIRRRLVRTGMREGRSRANVEVASVDSSPPPSSQTIAMMNPRDAQAQTQRDTLLVLITNFSDLPTSKTTLVEKEPSTL
eukprot:6203703-Pleurochrysis_carterae.AAC.2